jgi:hypothetical protein
MNDNINILSNFFSIIPSEDLSRTWPANRTIMLRITSKEIKDIIDKKYLPIFIKLNNIRPINFKFIMNRLSTIVNTSLITSLNFPDCDMKIRFEKFKEILSKCKLTNLNLYNNNLGDTEIESISEILIQQTNGQCSILNFAHNKITNIGFKSLLKLLNKGQKIDLNLCNNKIGYEYEHEYEYEYEGTKSIELCSTLSNLNLCYNQISNVDIDKILFNNKELKSLDLSQNKITTFNFNTSQNNIFILENLNLSYNNINILGAKNLSKILEKCPMLKNLNLSFNFIDTEGATDIIEKCLSLNSIFLTRNMITHDGMEKFIQVLIQRTSLINLTLTGNRIGDDILYNLSKLFKHRIKLIY